MPAVQLEFIASLFEDEGEGVRAIRELNITPDKLDTCPDAQKMLKAILAYTKDPVHLGRLPSKGWMRKNFKDVPLPEVDRTAIELAEEVDNQYLYVKSNAINAKFSHIGENNIREAALYATHAYQDLLKDSTKQDDYLIDMEGDAVMADYETAKSMGGVTGIRWPWEILNKITKGMLGGDYILFYGYTKSMKSYLVLYLLAHIYKTTDVKVLMYIREMTVASVRARLIAMIAGVDCARLDKGNLLDAELELIAKTNKKMKEDAKKNGSRLILMGGDGHEGVEAVRQKAKHWGAKVVFCDSPYLMKDDRTSKRSTDHSQINNISGDLRSMAKDDDVIVIIASQENERNAKQYGRHGGSSVAYATKLMQDVTMAFHVHKFKDPTTGETEIGFHFPATRDVKEIPDFTVCANPPDFSFKRHGMRNPADEGLNQSVPASVNNDNGWAGRRATTIEETYNGFGIPNHVKTSNYQ